MTSCAYCYRTGEIGFCEDGLEPEGTIDFLRGDVTCDEMRKIVAPRARHGYDGALLVPGVPEADDDYDAVEALSAWVSWAFQNDDRVF